jgi:FrmR/RcnR family transcriptional regulator, repressor of frmRAB operon
MPHSPNEKARALARLRRIRGQVEALERALEAESECTPVLQQMAATRGALNGLMTQVLESHIRQGIGQEELPERQRQELLSELIGLVRSYQR